MSLKVGIASSEADGIKKNCKKIRKNNRLRDFFSILNIYKKEVMPMQGKDDSNKRIAELQKMRRSDYAKTWVGRRRIKIEIEKIKKSMR